MCACGASCPLIAKLRRQRAAGRDARAAEHVRNVKGAFEGNPRASRKRSRGLISHGTGAAGIEKTEFVLSSAGSLTYMLRWKCV
jgi:hypothetical protein